MILRRWCSWVNWDTKVGKGLSSQHRYTANNHLAEFINLMQTPDASKVEAFPEPFRSAIKNSSLWAQERSQNCAGTACWSFLYARGVGQDVVMFIQIGYNDSYLILNECGGTIWEPIT